MASQQGRANQHELACFELFYPWSFPSRSGIRLHGVVQPWLPLQIINFAMKFSAPCSAPFPLVLGCSRALVGVDAESSEVVHPGNTPSNLFTGPSHSPRPPPILRTSRTSAVSHPPCAPQIPQTRSTSCVKSPRCSHFPS